MKGYIAILLLILLTSCAPTVEVDTAKPVETPISQKPEVSEGLETKSQSEEPTETVEEPEETKLEDPIEAAEPEIEENIIEIKEDSFYPKEKTIKINTEIKWLKKDSRNYKIACYLKGNRITQSSNLKEGDSFAYTFLKEGEYTCITSPYGLRNIINVESQQATLLSPTGSAVVGGSQSIKGASFAAIALIAIIILLFFIFGRKRLR